MDCLQLDVANANPNLLINLNAQNGSQFLTGDSKWWLLLE